MSGDTPSSPIQEPMLRPFHFSTAAERPDHQFDAWRSAMSGSIDVRRPNDDGNRPGFAASIDAWNLSGLGLVTMSMPGEGYRREWDHSPRAEADHWSLMVPVIDGSGRAYGNRPVLFGSLARPFRGSGTDMKVVTLFLPRDLYDDPPGVLDTAIGQARDRGVVSLVADFVLSVERRLGEGGAGVDPDVLSSALRSAVLAGLAPTPDRIENARALLQARLVERIMRYVRENLAAPDLDWRRICREFGLSRSTLHRLFDNHDGMSNVIRRERLLAAYRQLQRGDQMMAISVLAERFGFADSSSFSRAFRRAFGHSPRDLRGAELGSGPLAAVERSIPPLDAFLFGLSR